MERNTILAIVLSTGFLILWFMLIQSRSPSLPEQPVRTERPVVQAERPADMPAARPAAVSRRQEKEVTVQTPNAQIVFLTRGGAVKHWKVRDIEGWVDLVLPNDEIVLVQDASGETVRVQNVPAKEGVTLDQIAQTYLTNPAQWEKILSYNNLASSDAQAPLPAMNLKVPYLLIKEDRRSVMPLEWAVRT